ncbi:succinate dehydrogenase, hydrophobic membrane anchor protein [Frigidibacter sp. SD6-1]|uniref:succinate dehydrogenase, hydrophobic membrane anchor protein n=1 Tax=Frigidibacter sp. SD6-1 TaxID=3032581 RepID=UPI0024E00EEC|nr:succinate dehydrogenase, hydrophobic membrane anchor protein [Frigidibacter sp. SD6-1]
MRYLTDRKRAEGKGASHTGTEHHWYMQASGAALAFLVPVFVIALGRAFGRDHAGVVEFFARPHVAILTGLVLFVSMRHFAKGATMMIEDYARGSTRKALVIAAISLSYLITATGLFALARIAL